MNRVAFHIVPVIVWYVGAVAGRILSDMQERRQASVSTDPLAATEQP